MAKSHPAFDLLDRYFERNVMQPSQPAQGGTADGAPAMADPAAVEQVQLDAAAQEVARDSALIQMLAKAMGGTPQAPPKGSGRAL